MLPCEFDNSKHVENAFIAILYGSSSAFPQHNVIAFGIKSFCDRQGLTPTCAASMDEHNRWILPPVMRQRSGYVFEIKRIDLSKLPSPLFVVSTHSAAQMYRESKPKDHPDSGRAQCKVRERAAPGSHAFSITTGEKPFSGWIPAVDLPFLRALRSRRFEFLILNLNNLLRLERLQWQCKPPLCDDRWNHSGSDDRSKENRKLLSIDDACVEAVERRDCPERRRGRQRHIGTTGNIRSDNPTMLSLPHGNACACDQRALVSTTGTSETPAGGRTLAAVQR